MRLCGTLGLFVIASSTIVACSGSGTAIVDPNLFGTVAQNSGGAAQNNTQGQGGNANLGGSSNALGGVGPAETGGGNATGGVVSNGGNPTTGGKAAAGGSVATGGKLGTGGVVVTTGGNGNATGGVGVGTGGVAAATGGVGVGTGGVAVATGGKVSTGGSPAASCTDVPRSSETCAEAKSWGFCGQSWFTNCQVTCGTCGSVAAGGSGSTGGANASTGGNGNPATGGSNGSTGGSANSNTTNPQITGTSGWASRYWDCCMPSCSWQTNIPWCSSDGTTKHTGAPSGTKSGCESGGNAFECYDFSPWYDSSTNMAYGFAARNGVNCGSCWMLQFDGTSHNGGAGAASAIKGKQMVIQAINIGGIESNQFDLLIPGGGVGAMTTGCSTQWGSSTDFGATYGGLLSECNGDCSCMKGKCQSVFGSKAGLLAGCNWFTDWYACADNPNLVYKSVSCPSQITQKTGVSG